jgi:hypothetical protein
MTANDPALLRRCKGERTTVSRRVCAYMHFGSFNTFVLPSNSFAFVWHVRTHSNETRRRLCVLVQPAYSRRMTIRIYLNEPVRLHASRSAFIASNQLKNCAEQITERQRMWFVNALANVSSLLADANQYSFFNMITQ